MKTENLSTLEIHKLTKEQYERELAAGRIDENALYLTPEEEIDFDQFVTDDELQAIIAAIPTPDVSGQINTHNTDATAHSGIIANAVTSANGYTDEKIALLMNNSSEAVDSIMELAAAMEENEDVVDALEAAIGTKANASDLTAHTGDKNNPHGVTAAQVGAIPVIDGRNTSCNLDDIIKKGTHAEFYLTNANTVGTPKEKGVSAYQLALVLSYAGYTDATDQGVQIAFMNGDDTIYTRKCENGTITPWHPVNEIKSFSSLTSIGLKDADDMKYNESDVEASVVANLLKIFNALPYTSELRVFGYSNTNSNLWRSLLAKRNADLSKTGSSYALNMKFVKNSSTTMDILLNPTYASICDEEYRCIFRYSGTDGATSTVTAMTCSYNTGNKPTAADVGAVALNGSNTMTGALTIDRSSGTLGKSQFFKHNASGADYGTQVRDEDKDGNIAALVIRSTDNQLLFYPDGTSGKKVYHAGNKPTAADVGASKAITGITRSGTTFTATHIDGTTSTFTQQDNNTTYSAATQSANGLMSAADKTKLDGIANGANAYSHPTSSGNKHIPAGGSSGQILRWSADGTAAWGADNNTTYSNMTAATSSAAGKAGLVPAPAAGKQASFLRGDGTWVVPTNTTYSNFVKSGSGAKSGLVPAPSTTAGTTKYLREDGTWAVPPNTTYSNFVKSGSGAKAGLVPAPSTTAGTTKYLREDGTWQVPPNTNTDTKVTTAANTTTAKGYVTTCASATTGTLQYHTSVYVDHTKGVLFGAAWNDFAEYRISDCQEAGRVICENGDDTLSLATERLQPGANVVSDTFGFAIGETETAKTPIAVSGRVLVYPYEDRDTYKPGDAVCAAPNGTVSKMTREEIREYPERIIGTVSAIPNYETWGEGNVPVNGRIWIKVK